MDAVTAQSLISVIASTTRLAFDAHVKLVAFEKTLEEHQPELYQAYLKTLEDVRLKPPYQFDLGALAMLQQKLAQD